MLAALSASSRAEASLSTLMRSIRDLSSGVTGAREANLQLLRELEAMADLLGDANERQLALRNRVSLLEQTLERAQREAANERSYILEQQDAFIAAMMEDHEQVVRELNAELDAARARPSQRPTNYPELPSVAAAAHEADLKEELAAAQSIVQRLLAERERARETLLKLQAQRDEAQATVATLTRERDQARADPKARIGDAFRQVIPATSTPPPGLRTISALPPSDRRVPTDDRAARTSGVNPFHSARPASASQELATREYLARPSPPPDELSFALHPPRSSAAAPGPTSAPAPSQPVRFEKRSLTPPGPPMITNTLPPNSQPPPDLSLRPASTYSMTNSVAPEHVSSPPRVSRSPRR
jgi:chemotaxis protein histidine kinase CheA